MLSTKRRTRLVLPTPNCPTMQIFFLRNTDNPERRAAAEHALFVGDGGAGLFCVILRNRRKARRRHAERDQGVADVLGAGLGEGRVKIFRANRIVIAAYFDLNRLAQRGTGLDKRTHLGGYVFEEEELLGRDFG